MVNLVKLFLASNRKHYKLIVHTVVKIVDFKLYMCHYLTGTNMSYALIHVDMVFIFLF